MVTTRKSAKAEPETSDKPISTHTQIQTRQHVHDHEEAGVEDGVKHEMQIDTHHLHHDDHRNLELDTHMETVKFNVGHDPQDPQLTGDDMLVESEIVAPRVELEVEGQVREVQPAAELVLAPVGKVHMLNLTVPNQTDYKAHGVVRGGAFLWVETEQDIRFLRSHVVGFGMMTLNRKFNAANLNAKGGTSAAAANALDQHLQLSLAEAYYAAFDAELLQIGYNAQEAQNEEDQEVTILSSADECWDYFQSLDNSFPLHYVAYYKYRKAGWAPHSGLKYSCDYVLYDHRMLMKTRSLHAHAPYCVNLIFVDEENAKDAPITDYLVALTGRLRVIHNVVKKLILCQVIYPVVPKGSGLQYPIFPSASDALHLVRIKELMFQRWVLSKHIMPSWQDMKRREKIEARKQKKAGADSAAGPS
mmetsp:Transcript_20659/g.35613  ORF Transcript_20659/g.35613 Transcript_20659/m.35613 type:complete len:417 (-) Transcript_20659:92-1342(-)|eukprot:CAMPEP_0184695006 /NCGR_PEP_ID=MMETSP0313-20130426/2773_1 /TAXON_ID=2792 /ORGANISM="Porphyridium aerugineum, Strain SAG 1380-2" /LENGTH=416 /DNA_ID=CAMNT_0027153381 /DNA_START=114 /DNA_END=1364 /DNA_ORIENTATION=-